MKILCEGQIDAIVIFLGGDSQGENLPFAQIIETFHASAPRTALRFTLSATTQDFQHDFMKFRRTCSPLLRLQEPAFCHDWEFVRAIVSTNGKNAEERGIKQGTGQARLPQLDSPNLKKAAAALREACLTLCTSSSRAISAFKAAMRSSSSCTERSSRLCPIS